MNLEDLLKSEQPPAEINLSREDQERLFRKYRDLLRERERDKAYWQAANENMEMAFKSYQTLAENLPAIVYRLHFTGNYRIQFFNRVAESITGYREEDLAESETCPIISLIVEEDQARVAAAVQDAIRQRRPFAVEYRLRKKNGEIRDLHEKGSPIFGVRGELLFIDGLIFDITERKQAEEELAIYRERLEELVEERTKELRVLDEQLRQSQKMEAVGILARGIAHDFSNILSTVKGITFILKKRLADDPEVNKYLERIVFSLKKAQNLTQNLLSFSTKKVITPALLDLNELVTQMKDLILQITGEQVELKITTADRRPFVVADRTQIEQVLLNLVTNAKDAMPEGGELLIKTDLREITEAFIKERGFGEPGRYAVLSVSDTGTGIEEKIRENIFEPFFTTKDVGKGTGLGLAIAYGIIKQHKGHIDVYAEPGMGTTFDVYLPLPDSVAEEAGT
ncbi:MAG: ATP-binding protein [Nitrospirota bacterium]|nr:ATP-binding protein [Nitrospirota bacterium]